MSDCRVCGRGDGHYIGCEVAALKAKAAEAKQRPQPPAASEAPGDQCEHDGCSQPKKEWSGKGAKPKYCAAGHKKEK